ncbi:MAG: amidohydrolase family protein [Dehalococcoidia bacterium]
MRESRALPSPFYRSYRRSSGPGHRLCRSLYEYRGTQVYPYVEQILASESIIVGGVLERHPGLRVAFLECGCSWLAYWLRRLDEELEAWGWHVVPWLKAKPSEYYLRECFASMEGDEPGARYYIEMHGDDNLLWASDYTHPDASYPDSASQFLALDSISSDTQKKVLWDNPIMYRGFQPSLSQP